MLARQVGREGRSGVGKDGISRPTHRSIATRKPVRNDAVVVALRGVNARIGNSALGEHALNPELVALKPRHVQQETPTNRVPVGITGTHTRKGSAHTLGYCRRRIGTIVADGDL